MQGSSQGSPHLLYAVILVQFVVIAVLLGDLSNEYLSNDYFRAWVSGNYPWLGFLLQGQVDSLLVGVAFGATVLLIMTVKSDRRVDAEDSSRSKMAGPLLQPIAIAHRD